MQSLTDNCGRAKTHPVVANGKKLKSGPLGDSSCVSSAGEEDNINSQSPDKACPSESDDKNNPHCADAEYVAEQEEEPTDGDANDDDSIQAGVPFPTHDLPDLSEYKCLCCSYVNHTIFFYVNSHTLLRCLLCKLIYELV